MIIFSQLLSVTMLITTTTSKKIIRTTMTKLSTHEQRSLYKVNNVIENNKYTFLVSSL